MGFQGGRIQTPVYRLEYGAESVTDLLTKLSENIIFASKLELFSNLQSFDKIDVNWDNLFTAKVSTYLNVSLNIKLFYDKDISLKCFHTNLVFVVLNI